MHSLPKFVSAYIRAAPTHTSIPAGAETAPSLLVPTGISHPPWRIEGEDLEITWKYTVCCRAKRETAMEFSYDRNLRDLML
jgi:hypothetical protein